ncbi:MAG: lactate utilization protein [Deltaproteobacteria bacterium]|nr:lactate utilization protein [Deltaproteobacteria bacterium]
MKEWFVKKLVERTIKKLTENGFKASYFEDRNTLRESVLSIIPPGATIGVGGSVTVRELGIVEILNGRGFTVYDHWKEGLSNEERARIRKAHLTCQVFITGTNAITEDGEIVNIDGIGNRVASMIYGPETVIVIAGYKKIVKNLQSAIERIKSIAAPMNAKRLNLTLPCSEYGYCTNCKSEKRICRILTVIQKRPPETEMYIFIINEDIGF